MWWRKPGHWVEQGTGCVELLDLTVVSLLLVCVRQVQGPPTLKVPLAPGFHLWLWLWTNAQFILMSREMQLQVALGLEGPRSPGEGSDLSALFVFCPASPPI